MAQKAKPSISDAAPKLTAHMVNSLVSAGDDFGHELRVGSVIREFPSESFAHGGTYKDPVTGLPRQFDYRFILRKSDRQLCLGFTVECKNIQNAVVVCGYARNSAEAVHEIVVSRNGSFNDGDRFVSGRSSKTVVVHESDFFRKGQFVGKSVIRILRDTKSSTPGYQTSGDKDVYEKWAQALASADEVVRSATDFARDFKTRLYFSVVLPVLVIPDGMLWQASYSVNGELETTRQTEIVEYYVDRDFIPGDRRFLSKYRISHLFICTLSGLRSLLSRVSLNNDSIEALFPRDCLVT